MRRRGLKPLAAEALIREWLADESGYDEAAWPELAEALDQSSHAAGVRRLRGRAVIAENPQFCGEVAEPSGWSYRSVVMPSRPGSSQADCAELIRNVRRATPAELRAQRVSFAYGNVAIENPRISRETVEREAARIKPRASR